MFVMHIYNSDEVFICHLTSKHYILCLPFLMGMLCHILCLILKGNVVSYFASPILWCQGEIMLIIYRLTYVHTVVLLTKDIITDILVFLSSS